MLEALRLRGKLAPLTREELFLLAIGALMVLRKEGLISKEDVDRMIAACKEQAAKL